MATQVKQIRAGRHCIEYGAAPVMMGILNVTGDSFFDGGRFLDPGSALKQAREMADQGALIIDVGGQSTRPGYDEIDEAEELSRVLPVLERLVHELDVAVSVDTYKPAVAEKALSAGAQILNDIWGFQRDPEMARVAAAHDCVVVLMHNAEKSDGSVDVIQAIRDFLDRSVDIAARAGVKPERIILDPGVGFGKTPEQNIAVLARLEELADGPFPLLLGTSRKSTIGRVLGNVPVSERLEGTVATTVAGVLKGARFFRVHDVLPNLRAARMAEAIRVNRLLEFANG